jgi:hypothetical protein
VHLSRFNEQFVDFQPQGDPVLNAFGALLGSYFSTTPRVMLADISQCSLVPGLFFGSYLATGVQMHICSPTTIPHIQSMPDLMRREESAINDFL